MRFTLQTLKNRIYADFFLPCRIPEYRALLENALKNGYCFYSIESFFRQIQAGTAGQKKAFILRHDIDTDLKTAIAQWMVEEDLGIQSSYYFRLGTLDFNFMKKIHRAGGEVGYHYEELSTISKRRGFTTRKEIENAMPVFRKCFIENLKMLRQRTDLPLKIVAAHGDWYNRRIKVGNVEMLQDAELRAQMGIELEVYDHAFMSHVTSRHSDYDYPQFWIPSSPFQAIESGKQVIYLLVHPRPWHANVQANALEDLVRAWEGAAFHVRSSYHRSMLSRRQE